MKRSLFIINGGCSVELPKARHYPRCCGIAQSRVPEGDFGVVRLSFGYRSGIVLKATLAPQPGATLTNAKNME
jgi:hypothetical protein